MAGRGAKAGAVEAHHREGHELLADLLLKQEKPLVADCRLDIEPR